jgi:fructokinase
MKQKLYGGIELGGTKTNCAIGSADGTIVAKKTIPTTSAEETIDAIVEFFDNNPKVISLGVGSFGPVQLDASSSEYGQILNSPKAGWSKVGIKNVLEQRLGLAVSIDTDVNCAALGELNFGVAKNVQNFIYLTLGTGIGGSLVIDGKLVRGILNLEMGHMRIPHEPFAGKFKGVCSFHTDCLEGIASGTAMEERYGKPAEDISSSEAWNNEAEYIASALTNLMMTIGPEKIVLGGGLTNHAGFVARIRNEVPRKVNNYLDFPDLEHYIIQSSGNTNGVLGAIKMASKQN